jgi:hypothetical protein
MIALTRRLLALLALPAAAAAQNFNGSFAIVEQGGTIGAGNLATAGTPFARDLINGDGVGVHTVGGIIDGAFGNPGSWIGNSQDSWVGLAFAAPQSLSGLAFGRDNTGNFLDRAFGTFVVEYSNSDVLSDPAGAVWQKLGEITYAQGGVPGSLLSAPTLRHRFNFDPVSARAIRLTVPGNSFAGGAAIDELELFASKLNAAGPASGIVTSPAPGYRITWDGNDGAYWSPSGSPAAPNLALSANGGTAFSSGDLGPQLGLPFHVAANLNDGRYGNANSWIGGDGPATAHAGVMLNGLHQISGIAWGRDNGLDAANGDCCGGSLTDRWAGFYDIQITTDGSTWNSIGSVELQNSFDAAIGGLATGWLRHEFALSSDAGAILATGVRLMVPATGLGAGTAIDELEIFGTPIPEPGASLLGGLALGLAGFRRRRAAQ